MDLQLVFFLVLGVFAFIQWIVKQSNEARLRRKEQDRLDRGENLAPSQEIPQYRPVQTPPPSEEDAEASMRKLMEALGLPSGNEPPKPIQRPAYEAPPPLPIPEYRAPEPLPRPEPVIDPYAQKTDRVPTPAPVPRVEYRKAKASHSPESVTASSISLHDWNRKKERPIEKVIAAERRQVRHFLASPHGLREAMILSEILGKPKALQ